MSYCRLQAIARVGFGRDFGPDSPESIAINESWRNDVEIMSTFTGFITPIVLNLFPWITKLPIPALQEDGVTKKIIHRIGHRMLEEGDIKTDGRDIFSLLVKDWSLTGLTNDRLLDNIVTFMFAGFETSSSVISFTILSLAQNLETQEKLREQLTDVNTSDYNTMDKLSYLDAVVREGLRMHPSAHDTERISIREDVIPLQSPITMTDGRTVTSFPVKAGERFIVPWTVLNVSPAIWGSDAAKFRPERWLEPNGIPSSGLPRGPYSNIATFADGPRSCIGWRLAVMQIKIILAVLIKSFEFKDTGVHIGSRLVPSLQPIVDGKPGNLPLHV
ncbi:cytochrome P450, partial [Hymenopellis radicata]